MPLLEAIPGLKGLLEYFSAERHRRDDRLDAALAAIYTAASETKLYLARLEVGKRRSRKREAELARLWSRAGPPVRRFDADLADRCLMKSDFWIWPERWTPADVRSNRIGIDQVQEGARRLLLRR